MAISSDRSSDDAFTSRLVALDAQLAGGSTIRWSRDEDTDRPADPRLRSAEACLQLIDRVRRAKPDTMAPLDSQRLEEFPPSDIDDPPTTIGRFEIVRELGRGGYGVVFLAVDPKLDREVALKVPRPEVLVSPELKQRFLREAKAAACLDHPNIVPVFETGAIGALCYIASAYCDGPSLSDWLEAQRAPVAPKSAARVVSALAQAVQHAHSRGVLHRDLKPGNVILDPIKEVTADESDNDSLEAFHPKVLDFGLAKLTDSETSVTLSTAVIGTPAYMAPEQAAGDIAAVGEATDIYGLGAVLYALLTGHAPFQRPSDLATLQAVQLEEPTPPRRLRADMPRDLEAVCLRCLEKDPRKRYTSAVALAEDLDRYLGGRSVVARPIGHTERLRRWCRRNPVMAGLAATASLLLVAVAVVSTASAWQLARERTATQVNLVRAVEAEQEALRTAELARRRLFESLRAQAQAARRSGHAGQRFESIAALREAMSLGLEMDGDQRLALRNEAIASLSLVDVEVDRTWPVLFGGTRHGLAFDPLVQRFAQWDPKSTDIVLCRTDNQQPIQTLAGVSELTKVPQLRFGPHGRYLAAKCTAENSKWVQVWTLIDSQTVLKVPAGGDWFYSDFDISPDGRSLAACESGGAVAGYDLESAREVFRHAVGATPVAVRFHPREALLAVGFSDHARLVDIASGHVVSQTDNIAGVRCIDFHPDGSLLAIGGEHGAIHLFDCTEGRSLRTLTGHRSAVVHLDFNLDGTLLATTSWDTTTRIWDPASGEQLLVADMACHSFSRDDVWLGIGRVGSTAGRWKLAPHREYQKLYVGDDKLRVHSLDVGPRGRLVAAGMTNQIVVWSTSPGAAKVVLPTFGSGAAVAFESLGTYLISSGSNGVYRWSIDRREETTDAGMKQETIQIGLPERLAGPWEPGTASLPPALFLRGLAAHRFGSEGRVQIADLHDEESSLELVGHKRLHTIAIAVDRRWAATATRRGRDVVVWNLTTGGAVKRIPCGPAIAAFSPDGARLAVGSDEDYLVFEAPSWDLRYRIQRPKKGGLSARIAFSGDGSLLAITDESWTVRILEAQTGRELAYLAPPTTEVICSLAFARGSQFLAAGTESGTVHCWDLTRIRRQLANLRLDWEPTDDWTAEGIASPRVVRFDVDVITPLTAVRSLAAGDRSGYQKACIHLQDDILTPRIEQLALTEISLACTTGEGGLADADQLSRILEKRLAENPSYHDIVVPLMAVRHRCGEFAKVLKLAQLERLIYGQAVRQPSVSNWVKGLRVVAFAHLAMTHQKQEQAGEAKRYLAEAETLLAEVVAIRDSGNYLQSDLPEQRFLEAELLLAEAREMIDVAE